MAAAAEAAAAEAAAAEREAAAPQQAPQQALRSLSFGRAFGRKARPDAARQQQQSPQQQQSNASAPPAPDSGAAPARTQSFGRRGARAALGAASLLSRSVGRKAPNKAEG